MTHDESEQCFSTKFTTPSELEFTEPQPATKQPEVAHQLATHVTCRINPSKKRKRCMNCNDCSRYSFVQQHGPYSYSPDGTKPIIRQCAAWQLYDQWRKRGGNSLEYSVMLDTSIQHEYLSAYLRCVQPLSVYLAGSL